MPDALNPAPDLREVAAAEWSAFDGVVDITTTMLDFVGSAVYQQLLADMETAAAALTTARGLERMKLSAKVAALAERLRRRQALQPVVLQNRDRSTAASIAQVQSIAKNPDPDLLGFNKTATEGAPIVFADYDEVSIPSALLGRKTTVTFTKDMSKVPVQYAIVPAEDVMVSHDFNGAPVDGYDAMEAPGRLRAVAGNGRAAGIQLAYERDAAAGYKAGLIAEADLLQLDPGNIEVLARPMLVRVMRHEDVTSDIGDKTNSSGTAGLSAVEQAKTDADRVSFEGLTFSEDGTPTLETLTAFVRAMPVAEQATLAPDGTPTNQALDRLMAATFNRAYQNDDLVKLYSQSLDPEIKNVLFGMAQAAGDMAALAGKGDYDVRAFVTDAASMASNAKRAGLPLSRMAEQRDMAMPEESNDIAAMFARHARSAKKIGDILRTLARAALAEADAEAEDIFGPKEKRKPSALVAEAMGAAGRVLDAVPMPAVDPVDSLPRSWLGFKVVDQATVDAQSATALPSANTLGGPVYLTLDDESAQPLLVAATVVGVTFTADKVRYSLAVPIAPQPREGVTLYAIVGGVVSDAVSPRAVDGPVPAVLDSVDDRLARLLQSAATPEEINAELRRCAEESLSKGHHHGWLKPLPNGGRARCGGPGRWCVTCRVEQEMADAAVLDSAGNALSRLRNASALNAAVAKMRAPEGLSALERLKLAGQIRTLVIALGGAVGAPDDDVVLSDDPNSPNYRYADTGYIADSRKEKAANQIRIAKDAGQLVQATSIDWKAIERNPRQAAELIVKSNLFGQVDWTGLGAAGMDPAAGFLIDRVYASIAPAPDDNPQARKDYAVALTTIRSRLEGLKTVKDVRDVLAEILDEMRGANLNEAEAEQFAALVAQINPLKAQISDLGRSNDALYAEATKARSDHSSVDWNLRKRKDRGWRVEATHLQELADANTRAEAAWKRWADANVERKAKEDPLRAQLTALSEQANAISTAARTRNAESSLARGWFSFGPKFMAVVKYRYRNSGSTAFLNHVVNAENGKIKDWSWAEKERTTVTRGASKSEITFQLLVADDFQRIGGKDVRAESTAALKSAFGLREVQSGNWVLKDPNSARFHVEQTAGAFSDLSDVLGIDAAHLGLGGRLGMAFGARGSGGKNAARAHYEPVHRVVNLTKMGGGGTLGHELFHAFDNILPALAKGTAGAKTDFGTRSPDLLPEGPLRSAFAELRKALMTGEHRMVQNFDITDGDRLMAKRNVDSFYASSIGSAIKRAGNATDAILAVDALLAPRATTKKSIKNLNQWKQIAAAYYAPEGEAVVMVPTGRATSRYAYEAALLDNGEDGKYWSEDVELAARAFQSWLEDTLESQGRRNDYLSAKADNKHYDGAKPFPEGDERKAINAAFDKLFSALRESKVFETASSDPALLDAIFGALPQREVSPIEHMKENAVLLELLKERSTMRADAPGFADAAARNARQIVSVLDGVGDD